MLPPPRAGSTQVRSGHSASPLDGLDVGHVSAHGLGEHPGQAGVVVAGQAGQDGQPVQETQVPADDQHSLFGQQLARDSNNNTINKD